MAFVCNTMVKNWCYRYETGTEINETIRLNIQ